MRKPNLPLFLLRPIGAVRRGAEAIYVAELPSPLIPFGSRVTILSAKAEKDGLVTVQYGNVETKVLRKDLRYPAY